MLIWLGGSTPYLALKVVIAVDRPLISAMTLASLVLTRTPPITGSRIASRMPMMTITTISSTRVKASRFGIWDFGFWIGEDAEWRRTAFMNLTPGVFRS